MEILRDYCWVLSGNVRSQVVLNMQYEQTPVQLKRKIGKKFSNLCKVMQELRQRGILTQVACQGRCKLYQLTEKGQEISKLMERNPL